MKNPLEFSLLEIERIMADDEPEAAREAQRAYGILLLYLAARIEAMKSYKVHELAKVIQKDPEEISRRVMKALDAELLDNAEIVEVEWSCMYMARQIDLPENKDF